MTAKGLWNNELNELNELNNCFVCAKQYGKIELLATAAAAAIAVATTATRDIIAKWRASKSFRSDFGAKTIKTLIDNSVHNSHSSNRALT